MSTRTSRAGALFGAVGAIACIGVVVTLGGPADHSADAEDGPPAAVRRVDDGASADYARNARGLTYGILPRAEGVAVGPEDMPDLVGVAAEDGTSGYAYRDELFGPQADPKSPEQALAVNEQNQPHYINVYTSDGVTVIGRFLVNRPARK